MLFYSLSFFTIVILISIYSYIILKRSSYPIINVYLSVNVIIFFIPAFLYITFGITHPSIRYFDVNNFDYNDIFLYGLLLIFTFDLLLLSSYYFLKYKFNNYNFISIKNINFDNNFFYFYTIIFLSILIFDFIDVIGNNSFMNKDYIHCNPNFHFLLKINKYFESFYIFKNIKQIISEFSNLKVFLLIITLLYFDIKKSIKTLILLTIILVYNLFLGFIIGSRFNIIIILVIFVIVYFNSLIKLKNIIYSIILFFITLYIIPLVGLLRGLYVKELDGKSCVIIEEKTKFTINQFNYNNINIINENGILNTVKFLEPISNIFQKQSFLNKPLEILTSRLNYFDITLKSINYKLNNILENNFIYYFDNIYGLIPRILYPNKRILTNNANHLAVDLGIIKEPTYAVGLRPIAEGFIYIGYYYLIIALFLGFLFYLLGKIFQSKNIIIKASSLYISILIIKRDSVHMLIPGIAHELIVLLYLILIMYLINFYKRKTLS